MRTYYLPCSVNEIPAEFKRQFSGPLKVSRISYLRGYTAGIARPYRLFLRRSRARLPSASSESVAGSGMAEMSRPLFGKPVGPEAIPAHVESGVKT